MAPIAEVPTPEQAPAISDLKYKLAESTDIDVSGDSDTLYKLVDADVKGDGQPPVAPLKSTHGLSERVQALMSAVPQSEMPERILRMKRDGKCVACGSTDTWSAPSLNLVQHRIACCPGTGSGVRTKGLSVSDYISANPTCLACGGRVEGKTLATVAYHKLFHGCVTSAEEFELFKGLVFTDSDFPEDPIGGIDLSSIESEFGEQIDDDTWSIPQTAYRSIATYISGTVKKGTGKCAACEGYVPKNGAKSKLAHLVSACPATGSGQRTQNFFMAHHVKPDGACLSCNEAIGLNTPRHLLSHKLIDGCKATKLKELVYFMSLVFKNGEEIISVLKEGLTLSQTDSCPQRTTIKSSAASKLESALVTTMPTDKKGRKVAAEQESSFLLEMKAQLLGLVEGEHCKACGENVLGKIKKSAIRSILVHRLHHCSAINTAKLIDGREVSLFAKNKACLHCGKVGWYGSWRDLVYHKLLHGCARDRVVEWNFFRSLVFSNADTAIELPVGSVKPRKPVQMPAGLETAVVTLKSASRPKSLVAHSGDNMVSALCALIEDEHCQACGESIGPITGDRRGAPVVIAHKIGACPAINTTKLIGGKPFFLFAKDNKCVHCGKDGRFLGWIDLAFHKLVEGCSKDEEEMEFFLSLVFSGKELDAMLQSKASLTAQAPSQKPSPVRLATPPAPAFSVDPEALYLPLDTGEEVCRACKCLSGPGDHLDWNKTWIGCVECGEAYHRSCVFQSDATPLFNVTVLPKPCNPLKLTAETNWTCPLCAVCAKCTTTVNVRQCLECRRMHCENCSPVRKATIWSGQYHTCSDCRPSCISCSSTLADQRAQDSLMCRRCQVHWVKGLHCPTCLKAYSEDDEEEFPMIQCEGCSVWVHFPCTGLSTAELKRLEGRGCMGVYKCPKCKPFQVEATPLPCAACKDPGAQQYIAPGILAHTQCASLAKHLFRTVVQPHGSLVERKGIRSVGLGAVQLRTWDIKQTLSTSRHTWTLTVPTKEGDSYSVTSDGLSKHAFEAGTLEEIYASLRAILTRQSVKQHLIDRILGHFEEGCRRLAQLDLPSKRAPEPPIVIYTEEQPAKRLRRRKNSSPDSLPPVPESFLDRCTEDPLSCARTRGQSKGVPKPSEAPCRDDPVEPAVDSFNANFVPIRSDKLGQYRTTTLPMAYRLMGSKQIEKGDLVVARSGIAGYGLVAGRKYIPNELVIEYQGQIIGQALADWRESRVPAYKQSCYMFRLDDSRIIDATFIGNAARFINHGCQPNCRTKPVVVEGQPRILIIAKKEIAPGEELSYDYQFALDEDDGKGRLPCYCGARRCRGWMN